MKSGQKSRGYTIVEVLIVMAVTALMLVSALALVSGSQNKTEFTQAANDINQQINDVINEVASGYYGNANTQGCRATGSGPNFSGTANSGENNECIFVGKIMQFTNSDIVNVYSIAGLRQKWGTQDDATSIADAQIKTVGGSKEARNLKNGLRVQYVKAGTADFSTIGFFNAFAQGQTTSSAGLKSGGTQLDIYSFDAGTPPAPSATPSLGSGNIVTDSRGVQICLASGGTNQSALITVGGSNSQSLTNMQIKDGTAC